MKLNLEEDGHIGFEGSFKFFYDSKNNSLNTLKKGSS